jgi:hypothetical protein
LPRYKTDNYYGTQSNYNIYQPPVNNPRIVPPPMDNRPIDNRWNSNYMNQAPPQQLFNPLNPMINKYPPPVPAGHGLPAQNINMFKNPMYNPPPPQGQLGNYRMNPNQGGNNQQQPNKYYDNRYNNYPQ